MCAKLELHSKRPHFYLPINLLNHTLMFLFFLCLTGLCSLLFLRHFYPYFKGATDLFSIAGFLIIFFVTTCLFWVIVFTPYYLWFE